MTAIRWTGRCTIDPDTSASVHEVEVDGARVSVYVSVEVVEDRDIGAIRAVAEGKIEHAHQASGAVPARVDVTSADFR